MQCLFLPADFVYPQVGKGCPVGRRRQCQKLLVELSNYLDDELDCALRQELEFHLKACPECCVIVEVEEG